MDEKTIRVAFILPGSAPYRKLQIEEFAKIPNIEINVYYVNKKLLRNWNVPKIKGVSEKILNGIRISSKHGFFFGLKKIVKKHDLILIGGYDKLIYLLFLWIAHKLKKSCILIFDGISPKALITKENFLKMSIKNLVFKYCDAYFANGTVSLEYLHNKFGCDSKKIYNQYLTVDVNRIKQLALERDKHRINIRKKYGIPINERVIIYSGRLVKRKNVDVIINALRNSDCTLLICGDGPERKTLENQAKMAEIKMIITGFIAQSEELFKHYFSADVFALVSYDEPWGLVVNEALAAGLPVIVSDECGSSLDLVKNGENGFIVKAGDPDSLSVAIDKILKMENKEKFGQKSSEIISKWTVNESRRSFEKMIKCVLKKRIASVS